jgi:IS4 transposase
MFSNTRFAELLKPLRGLSFSRLVDKHRADFHCKGFSSWQHLCVMLFAHLGHARSLREVEVGFNQASGAHYHLGCSPVRRSTLADANAKRNPELFREVTEALMAGVHRGLRKELKHQLYLMDASHIQLIGHGYDAWTEASRVRSNQGLKLHLMLQGDASTPVFTQLTPPNVNDIDVARNLTIEPGATYVFDKGYTDYNWWHRFSEQGACFVTRFKYNAALTVVATHTVSGEAILSDETVQFTHRHPSAQRINRHYATPLRRIRVQREAGAKPLIIATNDFERSAEEIAALYKQRWRIELFFKWIKQHLKIKRFLGKSLTSVTTQLYTALIAYLLLYLARAREMFAHAPDLHLLLAELRTGLFQRPETEYAIAKRRRRRIEEIIRKQGQLAL